MIHWVVLRLLATFLVTVLSFNCIAGEIITIEVSTEDFRPPNHLSVEEPVIWPVNDGVVFKGGDEFGNELFFFDGLNIHRFNLNEDEFGSPRYFSLYQGRLYFLADGPERELYSTDGYSVEKIPLRINPDGDSYPTHLTTFDDRLYFAGNNGNPQVELSRQLFSFDGQSVHPIEVFWPTGMSTVNGDLFFMTRAETDDENLYRIAAGMDDPMVNPVPGFQIEGLSFTAMDWRNVAVFRVRDEYIATDGTNTFTLTEGFSGTSLGDEVIVDDAIYFTANDARGQGVFRIRDPDHGVELVHRTSDISQLVELNDGLLIVDELSPVQDELIYVSDHGANVLETTGISAIHVDVVFNREAYLQFIDEAGHRSSFKTDGSSLEPVSNSFAIVQRLIDLYIEPTNGDAPTMVELDDSAQIPMWEHGGKASLRVGSKKFSVLKSLSVQLWSDDPLRADFDLDGTITTADIDALNEAIREGSFFSLMDLDLNGQLNTKDRTLWVEEFALTSFGDSNLDGVFNSRDLVDVFISGEFEDKIEFNSTWATGDWNGDGDFNSRDLVLAFQNGDYEFGIDQVVVSVPESSGFFALVVAITLMTRVRGR